MDMDISCDEESQEENYQFLVKRIPVTFRNSRMSISLPETANELFSDDDGDDTSGEDNERERAFEDDALEYSSDGKSDEDFQVNFDAPELEKNDFKYNKEKFNDNFS